MAFEFLVAGYLLEHNIGACGFSCFPSSNNMAMKNFPGLWKRHMMIYRVQKRNRSFNPVQYSISKSTVDGFKDFSELIANVESKAERMRIVSKYKNTYWYYILFTSPYANKEIAL